MNTRITELFGIQYPIIQGAMQWISTARLAAAVSNAGGLGTINATTFASGKDLGKEIDKFRELTDKPFCVNISMLPGTNNIEQAMEYLDAAIDKKVPVIETSGRNPDDIVPKIKEAGILCMHKAPSVRFAKKAEACGVDAVAIVGYEAGGHPGMDNVSSMILWPKAAEELSVPVIGGGGICDGKSLLAALSLGLDGVVVGTRFMASEEAPVHIDVKRAITQLLEYQTTLTQCSIRNALRVMDSSYAQRIIAMEKDGVALDVLLPYISGKKTKALLETGDIGSAQLIVGQVAGRIDRILTVDEILRDMVFTARERAQIVRKAIS